MVMAGSSIALFRDNLSSELNLIFIYFSSNSSKFLVIDFFKSLILINSFSYFLVLPLFSLSRTSFNFFFPLIYSKYPFISPKTRYKGLLLVFMDLKSLIVTNPM